MTLQMARLRTVLVASGIVVVAAMLASCERKSPPAAAAPGSPPAAATSPQTAALTDEESAAKAAEIADAMLEAMGGRDAWQNTNYITWKYFNERRTTWDRRGNRVRVDLTRAPTERPSRILMDLENNTAQALEFGIERTGDDLAYIENMAKTMWVEDRYWLLMPFELNQEGVKLRYVGTRPTMNNEPAEVIEVSYDGVGTNPFGKYFVYVNPETHLVSQWDFFSRVADSEPRYSTIWGDWRRYGDIMLSSDRGEYNGELSRFTQIAVFDELPDSVFTSLELPAFIGELEAAEQAARDAARDNPTGSSGDG